MTMLSAASSSVFEIDPVIAVVFSSVSSRSVGSFGSGLDGVVHVM